MNGVEDILAALRTLRLRVGVSEAEIHDAISASLARASIAHAHEVRLGPRSRIDFVVDPGGIGIEVKKGKPRSELVTRQLQRYAEVDRIRTLILVVERSVASAPTHVNYKPVHYVALNKLWGISL